VKWKKSRILHISTTIKQYSMKEITDAEFSKLPINEQSFRWALFIASEGYEKNLSKKQIEEIAKKYKVNLNK
jgi:hypothetical protein